MAADLTIHGGQRASQPVGEGQANVVEHFGKLGGNSVQRFAVDDAHLPHLLGQFHLQLIGQFFNRDVGAFVQQQAYDDRRLCLAAQMGSGAAERSTHGTIHSFPHSTKRSRSRKISQSITACRHGERQHLVVLHL